MTRRLVSWGMLGLLFATTAYWAYSMAPEAGYDGFSGNDCQQHRAYVEATFRALNEGKPPIELWGDHCCLGSPIFRMYQYLPHLVAAGLMKTFGWGASHAMHFLIVCFWILQFPLAFFACRLMRQPVIYGVAVALLAPLISSVGLGGQSLMTYSAMGMGMFAQALGSPWLYLTLGMSVALSGWSENTRRPRIGLSIALGLTLGLMFHFHHYMGFLGVLAYAVLSVTALLFSYAGFRTFLIQTVIAASLFLSMAAHQFYSMAQDSPLVFQNTWNRPELWQGLGLKMLWYSLINGEMLDFKRVQILAVLFVLGLCRGLASSAPRFLKGLLLVLFSALFFLVGPMAFSDKMGDVFRFLQPERFLVLFQICAIFIAGYGLCRLFEDALHSVERPALVRWIAPLLVLALIGAATEERLVYVQESARGLISQSEMNATLDPAAIAAMGDVKSRERYWSDQQWAMNRWGKIPFQTIFSELGFPHVTIAEHSMSYGTEMTHHFDPQLRAHYSIFNVSRIITYESPDPWMARALAGPPLPDFTRTLYKKYNLIITEGPADGLWAIATIPSVTYTPTPLKFRDAVGNWLRKANLSEYPAIVPEHIAARWPWAVPTASQSAQSGGKVLSQETYRDGHSAAEMESPDGEHYAVFKMSFHPHWRFTVNGVEKLPVWVAPAYAAVKLGAGRNSVRIQFKEDPVRLWLFYFGWGLPLVFALTALVGALRSLSLRSRLVAAPA